MWWNRVDKIAPRKVRFISSNPGKMGFLFSQAIWVLMVFHRKDFSPKVLNLVSYHARYDTNHFPGHTYIDVSVPVELLVVGTC